MLKTLSSRLLLPSFIAMASISVTACGGGDKDDLGDRLGISEPSIRFVNAVPNSSLSLYRNGSNNGLNEDGVPYAGITKFSSFNDDNSSFSVRNSSNVQVAAAGGFNAADGHRYLAVALPDFGPTAAVGAVDLQVLDDPYNRKASVAPTVRFVDAAPSPSNVDVYVTKPDDPLGNPSVVNFGYQSFWPASGNDSQKLANANGKFRVRITAAGDPNTVLFDSQEIDIDANADAVIAVLPTQPGSALPTSALKRGDLQLRVNDGNRNGDPSFDVVDHP